MEECSPSKRRETGTKNWNHGKTYGLKCMWRIEECERLIRARKAWLLKRKFQQTGEPFLEYKRAAINTKSRLREIKKEKFSNFCENLNRFTKLSYIWETMNKFKHRFSKTEKANEYRQEQVASARTTFERLSKKFGKVEMPKCKPWKWG